MRPIPVVTPYDMADARATLTDPARHGCLPSVIQHNWFFLAEARGIRVHPERLAITAHLVDRPPVRRPEPDAALTVTMPDGRTLDIPVTTSLAAPPSTTGSGGTVDAIDATRARVSDRIRAMDRVQQMLRGILPGPDPKGAA